MRASKSVILEVAKEFEKLTGRKYSLFEEYKMDDAEIAVVVINSTAGTAKFVIDKLREQGVKAGLVKIRVFRPFPAEEIAEALKKCKAVAVMDKADSLNGAGGPLFTDVTSAMFGRADGVKVINYIYGLGGRDVKTDDIELVFAELSEIAQGKPPHVLNYLNCKE
jgi:pyruvate ferredoxin oxidoreductase alpha subunit